MTDMDGMVDLLEAVRLADEAVADSEARTLELVRDRARIVRKAHEAGLSWRKIGAALGVSGQRAHQMGQQGRPAQF
jgi:hypothetical protein